MFRWYLVYWVFSIKGCWILSKAFSAFYWDNHVVFVFGSVYVVNYIYRLVYVEPALHPRDEAYLIVMNAISLPVFYWKFLHLCSSWILAWSFLFLLHLCQVLVSGWCWSHKLIWEEFPLFGLFGIVSEGVIPAPLCMSGRIRLWTHLDLGFFFFFFFLVGRLLIPASTSAFVIGLFKVSTSSWFRLGRVQVSKNLSISSRCTDLCA